MAERAVCRQAFNSNGLRWLLKGLLRDDSKMVVQVVVGFYGRKVSDIGECCSRSLQSTLIFDQVAEQLVFRLFMESKVLFTIPGVHEKNVVQCTVINERTSQV